METRKVTTLSKSTRTEYYRECKGCGVWGWVGHTMITRICTDCSKAKSIGAKQSIRSREHTPKEQAMITHFLKHNKPSVQFTDDDFFYEISSCYPNHRANR